MRSLRETASCLAHPSYNTRRRESVFFPLSQHGRSTAASVPGQYSMHLEKPSRKCTENSSGFARRDLQASPDRRSGWLRNWIQGISNAGAHTFLIFLPHPHRNAVVCFQAVWWVSIVRRLSTRRVPKRSSEIPLNPAERNFLPSILRRSALRSQLECPATESYPGCWEYPDTCRDKS